MTQDRLNHIFSNYKDLKIAVLGDLCLDRYLEIDPAHAETSIETGLPVHNIVRVRSQAGAAGTILNNISALGVGEIVPVGFHGCDGEGFELQEALKALPGVRLDHVQATKLRRTFTYTKPLVIRPGLPPEELSRFDIKNWTPTPQSLSQELARSLEAVAEDCDALIVMDQVDQAGTGVITDEVLQSLKRIAAARPDLCIIADSRNGLRKFPACHYKMNATELAAMQDSAALQGAVDCAPAAQRLAAEIGHAIFVSMSEHGILYAAPEGAPHHVPALPLRGPIDVVGAGDCVTANLAAAIAARATHREAMELAMLACSHVVHQLGTSGSASLVEIAALLAHAGCTRNVGSHS
ncbi:MAG: PfkB family carbohydrate kinase [Verrucomicrobiota bacterium]